MTSDGELLLTVRDLKRAGIEIPDFELAAGEAMAVLGPSGSGKSLFLRALADLDPNEGDLRLGGEGREAMSGPHWRRRVTYVPAESGWWAERVGEHFESWDIAAPWAERLGVPAEAGGWPVSRLSTGERQRLALVRAMAQGARILLLDEPTSGLDVQATRAVEERLREFVTNGGGLIFVTHDPAQAERLARRCLRFAKAGTAEISPCR
jgi:phosphate-transporting ATPase